MHTLEALMNSSAATLLLALILMLCVLRDSACCSDSFTIDFDTADLVDQTGKDRWQIDFSDVSLSTNGGTNGEGRLRRRRRVVKRRHWEDPDGGGAYPAPEPSTIVLTIPLFLYLLEKRDRRRAVRLCGMASDNS